MVATLRSNFRQLTVAALLVAAASCGKGSGSPLTALVVTPATATVAIGHTQALAISGTRADGSSQAVTDAAWTSSTAAIATVDASGLVTGVAAGSATITAASAGLTATATITVTAPALVSLTATPATLNLAPGATQGLAVTGKYDDGSTATLTSSATFTSSKPAVATVSAAGVVTAVAAGTATITAGFSGQTAAVAVTVTAPAATLASIAVTPATVSLAPGATQALAVKGTYSDGTTATLTSAAAYASSKTSVATVSAAGVVTAVAAGAATITATVSGKTATSAVTVTGTAATLLSIAITPSPVTLELAGTAQLAVTGTYSAGPTQDLTASAIFTSNDATTASVSSGGLISGVNRGNAVITASVTPAGGSAITASAVVNVGGAVFFAGAYGSGLKFVPFGGSTNAVTVDATTTLNATGHGSLKIVYPASGYTGGAFVATDGATPGASAPRNLSGFDSLTFWAKASASLTLEKVGIGNNGGFSTHSGYDVEEVGFALTTSWQKFVVPIPLASKLTSVDGLFHFADGTNHAPAVVWLADVQYESLGQSVLGTPAPAWLKTSVSVANALTYQIVAADLKVDYTINSAKVTLSGPNPNYFSFSSDNPAATVSATGLVTGKNSSSSAATANLTASLGAVATANKLVVTVSGGQTATAPTTLPPSPVQPAGATVISLYSSTPGGYNGTASDKGASIDTWLTCWSAGTGGDPYSVTVGAQTASPRKYVMSSSGNYVGIEILGKTGATQPGSCGGTITGSHELDISAMDHFHVDVWTPDDNTNLQFKLVDAGADGKIDGQETNGIATLTGGSTPPLATGHWLSYDLSFATGFPGNNFGSTAANLHHFGQLVVVAPNGGTLYLDNIYFYGSAPGGGGAAPTAAAAAPTAPAANVISLFSSAYTGGAAGGDSSGKVDSYAASCFGPPGTTVSDYTIAGTTHAVKQYAIPGSSFAIVELIGATGGTAAPPDSILCHGGTQTGANLIDVSGMTAIHFDVWSATGSANFQVQLVSADGTRTIAGPGAASGATSGSTFSSGANVVGKSAWVPFDLNLSTLGPPGAPAAVTRLGLIKFFTTDAGTFFVDNLYFHK